MALTNLLQELNVTCCLTLQQKINAFIRNNLPCTGIFIVHLTNKGNEGVVQVVDDKILSKEFRFSLSNRYDMKAVNISEKVGGSLDHELEEKLKLLLDPFPKRLLRVSIRNPDKDGQISFFVYLVEPNYKSDNSEYNYSLYVKQCFSACSAILLNACCESEERKIKEVHKNLLQIAKDFLLQIGGYNELLSDILAEARHYVNAERCSLFLLSQDRSHLVPKIFDGAIPTEKAKEIQIPVNCGIVGYVATTGNMVNVHNAQSHPLFYSKIDKTVGFKTRNILCFPIKNEANQVVGVAEMCNKEHGWDFSSLDEEAAEIFGIYIGIALVHGIVHKKIEIVEAKNRISSELVSYYLTKNEHEVEEIFNCKEKHKYQDMLDHNWLCRQVNVSDTVCYVVKMFENLGFVKKWKMNRKTLALFLLSVKRGYRDLPYHNWSHAFSVAHFAYHLMHSLNLIQKCSITKLEGCAFLVSALCHDLDHRGTSNSFQVVEQNNLASLYHNDGSVLERHHYSQTLTILNSENCNIFENLPVEQYVRVLFLIRDMIIATDMMQHFEVLPNERDMGAKGYNPGNKEHKSLLLSLMMTCCDLNDQIKGWLYCRDIAAMIYAEFFAQGDLERLMGRIPIETMDREKAFIPQLQMEFLTRICIPCFTVLSVIFPSRKIYVTSIEETANCWGKAIQWFKDNNIPECASLDRLFDPALEKYVLGN